MRKFFNIESFKQRPPETFHLYTHAVTLAGGIAYSPRHPSNLTIEHLRNPLTGQFLRPQHDPSVFDLSRLSKGDTALSLHFGYPASPTVTSQTCHHHCVKCFLTEATAGYKLWSFLFLPPLTKQHPTSAIQSTTSLFIPIHHRNWKQLKTFFSLPICLSLAALALTAIASVATVPWNDLDIPRKSDKNCPVSRSRKNCSLRSSLMALEQLGLRGPNVLRRQR
jgi:hypothetical protein